VNNHVYAVLHYDEKKRHVTVFNPWGNDFTPKGPPGPANGYLTERGKFTVPLEEFHQIFNSISYEIDKPKK
jgi:hypothetical protein